MNFLRNLIFFLCCIGSSAAMSETCAEVAQRAYDTALQQCQDNRPECRVDTDCGFGYRCNVGRCVLAPSPVNCVPNCIDRRSDGTCRNFGADFCGRNPTCAETCSDRRSDGTCRNYGADFCGAWASCSPNCTDRRSDGTCRNYGADICN